MWPVFGFGPSLYSVSSWTMWFLSKWSQSFDVFSFTQQFAWHRSTSQGTKDLKNKQSFSHVGHLLWLFPGFFSWSSNLSIRISCSVFLLQILLDDFLPLRLFFLFSEDIEFHFNLSAENLQYPLINLYGMLP